jgi:hypothetical protein
MKPAKADFDEVSLLISKSAKREPQLIHELRITRR